MNNLLKSAIDGFDNNKTIRRAVFVFLVVTQVLVMLYWMRQKSNYFIDELFSMGYAHTYTFDSKDKGYINESDVWQEEKWMPNSLLKDQIEVSHQDSLLSKPLGTAVPMLLLRRTYHGILNIFMSSFSPGVVGKVPGIVLNIIIFCLTQLVLFGICFELTGSNRVSLAVLTMYGYSLAAISFVMYIRFYCFVVLLFLLALRVHQEIRKTDRLPVVFAGTIVSMVLLFFAMKDSELVFVLGASLIGAFMLDLILCRQFKKLLMYFLTIVPLSLVYLTKETPFIRILLHPSEYRDDKGPAGWLTQHLLEWTWEQKLELIRKQNLWFANFLFGNSMIAVSFLLIIAILAVLLLIKIVKFRKAESKNKSERGEHEGDFEQNVAIEQDEAISQNEPIAQGAEQDKLSPFGFYMVLFLINAIYLIFGYLTGFTIIRYFSFNFPIITVLVWAAVYKLSEQFSCRKEVLTLCGFLTIAAVIVGFSHPEDIQFIYPEDRELICSLQEGGVQYAVVLCTKQEKTTHVIYDCVNLMEDDARIYAVQEGETVIDPDQCPERFLIWALAGHNIWKNTDGLLKNGCTISMYGKTHASDVYLVELFR